MKKLLITGTVIVGLLVVFIIYQLSPIKYRILVKQDEYNQRCKSDIRWWGAAACEQPGKAAPYIIERAEPRIVAWWNRLEIRRTFSVHVVTTEDAN
jgi:hypothetical protein